MASERLTATDDTLATEFGEARETHGDTFDRDAAGRFQLGAELGRGGMGRVVAASDAALDRPVAVKQLLSDRPEDRARFEREVRITAKLEHPAIVPVHEAGRDASGRPYYVMRRIAGESLAMRLARATDLSERLALLPSLLTVVEAAAFAHSRGVIHRDIKPANIMLGDYGEALLIDWGLARRLDEASEAPTEFASDVAAGPLTKAGDVYGTLAYMPPEQARGEQLDERADVFALGATLYHVLAGVAPFARQTLAERLVSDHRVDVAAIGAGVPRELAAIVGVAMAVDPDARYRTASGLASDLRAFLAGQLVAAHRYTPLQRVARFVRRHRAAVAIVGAAVIAAAAFAIVSVRNIIAARDDEQRARKEAVESAERAEERAHARTLDRAYTLHDRDPTHAALLLRGLPGTSALRRRAHDIATAAAAFGIAHGVDLPGMKLRSGALSPDGQRLAVGVHRSEVLVCTLATAACWRMRASDGPTETLVWLDDESLACTGPDGLFEIDTVRRTTRKLVGDPVHHAWPGPGGRVRFVAAGELRDVSRANLHTTTVARDVGTAAVDGDLALVAGNGKLRLVEGTREIVLAELPPELHAPVQLSVERSRGRAIAVFDATVRMWDLAGREASPYPALASDFATGVVDTAAGVVVATPRNLSILGRPRHQLIALEHKNHAKVAMVPDGFAFVHADGTIEVRASTGVYKIPLRQEVRVIVGSQGSPYLVALLDGGTLRWWDLRRIVVPAIPLELAAPVAWSGATYIVTAGAGEIRKIDRRTGKVLLERSHELFVGPSLARGVVGNKLYMRASIVAPGRSPDLTFDLETGALEPAAIPSEVAIDAVEGPIYARGEHLIARRGGEEHVLWTAREAIELFVVIDRWVVMAGRTWIRRVDRTTGAVVDLTVSGVERIEVDGEGTLFWSEGRTLMRWSGIQHPATVLPTKIHVLFGMERGAAVVLDDDSLWMATRDEVAVRSPPGGSKELVFSRDGRAIRTEHDGRITLLYLESNVAITVQLQGRGFALDLREVLIASNKRVLTWRDPIADPEGLDAWLAGVTNATLERGAVTWPQVEPPP